jgi:hypothetical protein
MITWRPSCQYIMSIQYVKTTISPVSAGSCMLPVN